MGGEGVLVWEVWRWRKVFWLYRRPVWRCQGQCSTQWQSECCQRRTYPRWRAWAAQVEQASLELHLPGVLPQSLPDRADFLLTVSQRCQGTRVEGFPVAVDQKKKNSNRKKERSDRPWCLGADYTQPSSWRQSSISTKSEANFDFHGNSFSEWNNSTE